MWSCATGNRGSRQTNKPMDRLTLPYRRYPGALRRSSTTSCPRHTATRHKCEGCNTIGQPSLWCGSVLFAHHHRHIIYVPTSMSISDLGARVQIYREPRATPSTICQQTPASRDAPNNAHERPVQQRYICCLLATAQDIRGVEGDSSHTPTAYPAHPPSQC